MKIPLFQSYKFCMNCGKQTPHNKKTKYDWANSGGNKTPKTKTCLVCSVCGREH